MLQQMKAFSVLLVRNETRIIKSKREYNYLFVDPNYATILFTDPRLDNIANLIGSAIRSHPYVSFLDSTGLLRNSHQVIYLYCVIQWFEQDEGMGNDFLSYHQSMDILVHVVRGFQDNNLTHVSVLWILSFLMIHSVKARLTLFVIFWSLKKNCLLKI